MSTNDKRYHLVYGLGAALLGGAVNLAFLWQQSHFLSLAIFALWLSIILYYEMTVTLGFSFIAWQAAAVVVIAVSGVTYKIAGPNLPAESETHGWLMPANESTPENVCDSEIAQYGMPKNGVLFLLGDSAGVMPAKEKATAFTVGDCPILRAAVSANGLLIDVDDYDEDGHLEFRIQDNEFHVVPQFTAYEDRSKDRSTITVTAIDGTELLKVKYVNKTTVAITGKFGCKDHPPITVSNTEISGLASRNTYAGICAFNQYFAPRQGIGHF